MKKIIQHIKNYLCNYLKWKRKFGNFGKGSRLVKPYLLSGTKNIFIYSNTFIRDNSRIETVTTWHNNQILNPCIEIGSNTSFEQNLHLICGNSVKIGSNCVFSANVFISDLNHDYKDINQSVMLQSLLLKDVEINDGCFVGYGTCILPGVHLGRHCVVGANAVVTKSFPDYCVIAGNPAICIKRYSITSNCWIKTDEKGNYIE